MVQNTVCAEAGKRQEFSSVVEAEIGSGVLALQRPFARGNNRFSLFKWFKRRNRDSEIGKRSGSRKTNIHDESSSSSSNESINTFSSTTTVRSFAFQNGFQRCNGQVKFDFPRGPDVGPFGKGAVKLVEKGNHKFTNVTSTLPNNFLRKRDITERYSLQPSNSFKSCGNIPVPVKSSSVKGKKVHVKGKRRAPNPPDFKPNTTNVEQTIKTGRRKRRPAPRPPEKPNLKVDECTGMHGRIDDLGTCPITDTLMLRGGVLLPRRENKSASECSKKVSGEASSDIEVSQIVSLSTSTLGRMPRPWYKRSVFENSREGTAKKGDIRNSTLTENREESGPSTAMASCESSSKLSFFHRKERSSEDRRREAKRKSGISILTNISQLDKEAAAIFQEEQARAKSTLLQNRFIDLEDKIAVNEELVQNMVTSTMESSPKRSTRALISKFNAISNLTKVSVNSNFFTKSSPTEKRREFDYNQIRGETKTDWIDNRGQKDLSRYFLPHQNSAKQKSDFKVEKKFTGSDNQIGKMQRPYEDASAATDNIPEEKEDENEKPTTSSKSDRTSNENIWKYSFPLKVPYSDNKVLTRENDSMSRKLDTIFDEIDKELQSNNMKYKENSKTNKDSTNQVTKIIDFTIESEKAAKENKFLDESTKAFSNKEASLIKFDAKQVSPKGKMFVLNTEEDPLTTDLKELLKEMKHSLPKRSKLKKVLNETEIPKVNNEPSTSTFRESSFSAYLKKDDLLKSEIVPRKQKVSSGVQTSGNVRKINLPMQREIFFNSVETKEQNSATKLIKNQFHLIRPKDFAEIEATKIVKKSSQENTYANVIEQSLYANAVVPPPKSASTQSCGSIKEEQAQKNNYLVSPRSGQKERLILSGKIQQDPVDEFRKQNMNTLAVNKLLKKLETAIASGNHQQAAMLAKELAQLKIHCSMIRQRAATARGIINVNMYIEDKEGHQGPIPLLVPNNMTVAQLKAKIFIEFEIPTNIQRWIIGKNLSDNDDSTLEELQTTEGSPVFLYLVAPDLNQDDVVQAEKINPVKEIEKANIQEINLVPEITKVPLEVEEKGQTTEAIKLERYEELISLENFDVVPNSEPIECPICFVTYGAKEGITLRDCLHAFCRPCIANTILYCEEAEVKCPYTDSEYTCEAKLQEREIKALVAPKVYQQHLAKSIAQAENAAGNAAFHCKTPDCFGWCIYDDNVNNFLCPVCHQNNCLTCQVIHVGKNCRQYQEELRLSKETAQESKRTAEMLAEMVDRGEALPCPTCAVVLMKKWGCDWLRCTMCKTEICWVTKGPRWGPAGKGDTSGGCKCGENGVKCHPRCNYCH
ncbi:uncharacterized protein LOC117167791 isoform X2 [Belonocnema kinseyi]|uniref:uncharacterized protein LOC117167791 isoform X2 n=1 Tax=Belonocnema kinseyi TaxID=2817044 RepID=UPI00143DE96F|nr:uncharacterized protein LOC117167791 isoform X2 [Belonocnema kinseyi]